MRPVCDEADRYEDSAEIGQSDGPGAGPSRETPLTGAASHILIADDNPTNRKLLRAILEAGGYHVTEAPDGEEALRVLEGVKIDAIISDVLMPRMDGYRFCHEVRKHPKFSTLPFLFLTATYTSRGDVELALELGADRILTNPLSS